MPLSSPCSINRVLVRQCLTQIHLLKRCCTSVSHWLFWIVFRHLTESNALVLRFGYLVLFLFLLLLGSFEFRFGLDPSLCIRGLFLCFRGSFLHFFDGCCLHGF